METFKHDSGRDRPQQNSCNVEMASETRSKRAVVGIILLFAASLFVIFYSNILLKPNYTEIEIQYVTSNDTNFAYVATCANQTRITTVVYKELPPLQDALNAFDWVAVETAFEEQRRLHPSGNVYLPTELYEAYLNVLVPYLEQPPKYPIEVATRPVPLSYDCRNPKYSSILTGDKREKPVKAYDFVPFNAELDVLEMRLYELNDTVDYFVILESTLTHRAMRKPLFYARNTQRFAGFQNKIIHLIMDDGDVLKFRHSNQAAGDDWTIEKLARYLIWTKFLSAYGDPEPDALLIHGDLDEIPSGEAIHHFRHCELKDNVLATGLYNYVFDFFHLTTVEYLAVPVIGTRQGHRMDSIGGFCRAGCNFGRSIPVVPWTGSHVTYHAKVPFLMWKHVSLAEGGQVPRGDLSWLKDAQKVENELVAGRRICCAWDHWPHVADAAIPKPNFIPWFAENNKRRFYYLFREEGVLLDKPSDDSVGIENVFVTHDHTE